MRKGAFTAQQASKKKKKKKEFDQNHIITKNTSAPGRVKETWQVACMWQTNTRGAKQEGNSGEVKQTAKIQPRPDQETFLPLTQSQSICSYSWDHPFYYYDIFVRAKTIKNIFIQNTE